MEPIALAGPVTVTQLAQHTPALLRAVRERGQVVPVSHNGEVVVVIRPVSISRAAAEADLDDPNVLVSARSMERDGPSRVIQAVRDGETRVLTFQNKPFALVTPGSQWPELDDLFADVPLRGSRSLHEATYEAESRPPATGVAPGVIPAPLPSGAAGGKAGGGSGMVFGCPPRRRGSPDV